MGLEPGQPAPTPQPPAQCCGVCVHARDRACAQVWACAPLGPRCSGLVFATRVMVPSMPPFTTMTPCPPPPAPRGPDGPPARWAASCPGVRAPGPAAWPCPSRPALQLLGCCREWVPHAPNGERKRPLAWAPREWGRKAGGASSAPDRETSPGDQSCWAPSRPGSLWGWPAGAGSLSGRASHVTAPRDGRLALRPGITCFVSAPLRNSPGACNCSSFGLNRTPHRL